MLHLSKLSGAAILFLALAITGCAPTFGNKAIESVGYTELKEKIVIGETTKRDIIDWYGQPSFFVIDENGHEQWSYLYAKGGMRSARARYFTVRFDGDGKVKTYNFAVAQNNSESDIAVNVD